jgi:hypothetical protein
MEGSGGFGAVSVGISEPLVGLILLAVLVIVIVGGWKLAKLLWVMFSG